MPNCVKIETFDIIKGIIFQLIFFFYNKEKGEQPTTLKAIKVILMNL
jgi:hypothetical protein